MEQTSNKDKISKKNNNIGRISLQLHPKSETFVQSPWQYCHLAFNMASWVSRDLVNDLLVKLLHTDNITWYNILYMGEALLDNKMYEYQLIWLASIEMLYLFYQGTCIALYMQRSKPFYVSLLLAKACW